MEFVFWQSILSIHQSTFLNALSKEHNVTLVVERETDEVRQQSGWINPTLRCNLVIIKPDAKTITKIISEKYDSIHVISGLEMTFQDHKLTKRLTDLNYKVICYLEPFKWFGIKGIARQLKYSLLRIKYGKSISAMLPTGQLGVRQYEKIGFKNVYEWGYFIENSTVPCDCHLTKSTFRPKLLFVGSLDTRKNILTLLNIMTRPEFRKFQLTVIGDGPLRNEVISIASQNPNISYIGVKPNKEVHTLMSKHDILILPSIFDGWGAVINEALYAGMRVVCSDRCGAATLLNEEWRGTIFSLIPLDDFPRKLKFQLDQGSQSEIKRKRIIDWCNTSISGNNVTKYFIDICEYQFGGLKHKPIAPWRRRKYEANTN